MQAVRKLFGMLSMSAEASSLLLVCQLIVWQLLMQYYDEKGAEWARGDLVGQSRSCGCCSVPDIIHVSNMLGIPLKKIIGL